LIVFGAVYYTVAEYIVRHRRTYRYGIEEGLALIAMMLFCTGCGWLLNEYHIGFKYAMIAVSALFAFTAFWIYLRFGYLYAALISILALCVIPFQLSVSPTTERLMLLFVLCVVFVFRLISDKPDIEDFKKERNTTIQACLLVAIYVTVNLQILGLIGLFLSDPHLIHLHPKLFPPYIYWLSYILTFILPAAGIFWGIQSRKRLILNTNLVMACITLATNKSYLGMTRYAWDPAILGVVLIALSILISRWLASGPNKARHGFTAENILKPEDHGINLADAAAALTPGVIEAQQPQTPRDKFFEGGSSGGGGASRDF
jgi:Ca2+/Na+ antiporter